MVKTNSGLFDLGFYLSYCLDFDFGYYFFSFYIFYISYWYSPGFGLLNFGKNFNEIVLNIVSLLLPRLLKTL